MQDEISEAVLANEDVVKYLRGGYGDSGAQAREKIHTYLDELRTTQRHKFYRALQHPLYPILRKIERRHENLHHVLNAVGRHRRAAQCRGLPGQPAPVVANRTVPLRRGRTSVGM